MSKNLIIILISMAFLISCSSTTEKADDAVAVTDQGTSFLGDDPAPEQSDAETYGTEEDDRSGISALDSPQPLPAVKIVYFDYDSSDVKPEDRTTIEAHAAYLSENPNIIITLEGHTDERGSREYNLALGERRTYTVKRQMMLLGVSSDRVRAISYGEERPAIDAHDNHSWSENRRVEFIY